MSKTWAIARLMIAEGIRMKIALVFVLLIGAVVLGLPFSITGRHPIFRSIIPWLRICSVHVNGQRCL